MKKILKKKKSMRQKLLVKKGYIENDERTRGACSKCAMRQLSAAGPSAG